MICETWLIRIIERLHKFYENIHEDKEKIKTWIEVLNTSYEDIHEDIENKNEKQSWISMLHP